MIQIKQEPNTSVKEFIALEKGLNRVRLDHEQYLRLLWKNQSKRNRVVLAQVQALVDYSTLEFSKNEFVEKNSIDIFYQTENNFLNNILSKIQQSEKKKQQKKSKKIEKINALVRKMDEKRKESQQRKKTMVKELSHRKTFCKNVNKDREILDLINQNQNSKKNEIPKKVSINTVKFLNCPAHVTVKQSLKNKKPLGKKIIPLKAYQKCELELQKRLEEMKESNKNKENVKLIDDKFNEIDQLCLEVVKQKLKYLKSLQLIPFLQQHVSLLEESSHLGKITRSPLVASIHK